MTRVFDAQWECHVYAPNRVGNGVDRPDDLEIHELSQIRALSKSRRFQIEGHSIVNATNMAAYDGAASDGALVLGVIQCHLTSQQRSE